MPDPANKTRIALLVRNSMADRVDAMAEAKAIKRHAIMLAAVARGMEFFEADPDALYAYVGRERVTE